MDFDIPSRINGRIQKLIHKLLCDFFRQPSRAELHENLAGSQVFRLYLFQRLYIDVVIFGINFCGFFRPSELFPHIAGEVFVRHQVLLLITAAVAVHRIQEDNALQFLIDFLLGLARKGTHIFHIHTGFFAHRYGKRFADGIHRGNGCVWLDRPLREHIRLALQFSIFVQYLQCGKQGKGAVLRKSGHIRTGIDQPVLFGKVIVKRI